MVKRITIFFAILITIIATSVGSFILGYRYHLTGRVLFIDKNIALPTLVDEAIHDIQENYYKPINENKLRRGAVEGVVNALNDPYSQYLDLKDFSGFKKHMTGTYSGVGLNIEGKNKRIIIVNVFENTPASRAGLKGGYEILKVEKTDVSKITVDQASQKIRGKAGTKVHIKIKGDGKIKTYTLIRENIDFPNIVDRVEKNKIGYVRLYSFTDDVGSKIAKRVENLKKKGIKALIFDLRGNPGGELLEAINITSLFLKKGTVLKTVDRKKTEQTYNATGDYRFDGPMVILVDDGSASASEIVAGALKDHKRAVIMGTKTFGKGSVQDVINLSNGGAMLITTQKWLTPSGVSISKKGIMPNKIVKNPHDQLDKAIEYLNNK